jgi:hypothetical protein
VTESHMEEDCRHQKTLARGRHLVVILRGVFRRMCPATSGFDTQPADLFLEILVV